MFFSRAKLMTMAAMFAASSIIFGGCGGDDGQQQSQVQKAQVKAMKVIRRDTPLASEYAGHLVGTDEVKVQSKVNGNVIEKFVVGGQYVQQGQLLYKIDSRQYETAVLQARAQAAEAEVRLNNARMDLARYQQLLQDGAIPEQQATTQAATMLQPEPTTSRTQAATIPSVQSSRVHRQTLSLLK